VKIIFFGKKSENYILHIYLLGFLKKNNLFYFSYKNEYTFILVIKNKVSLNQVISLFFV
jgi:hypothetical protein